MRVAISIDSQFIPMTGIQHSVDGLIKGLFQLDTPHEIAAFASYLLPNSIERAVQSGPETFSWRSLPRARIDAGFVPALLPESFRRNHVWLSARVRSREEELMTWFDPSRSPERRVQKYDVIHITEPGHNNMRYLNWNGPRHVATIYDIATILFSSGFPQHHIDGWRRYFDYAANHCARVVTISESTKRDIVERLKIPEDRITVTPLAPRASTRRVSDSPERRALLSEWDLADDGRPFLLYAGTLEPRKNVERLVRAFADVIRQNPSLPHRLVLAGGKWNNLDHDLRSLAAELGIGERIITTGYVTNAQLNALMSACTAFAYVSLYEGFGMPPLEAMTCGAPVIVSNASSLPEVVGNAGIQVNVESVEEIGAAIYLLLTDDAENKRRCALSIERAAQFSWQRTAELTLHAYEAAAS